MLFLTVIATPARGDPLAAWVTVPWTITVVTVGSGLAGGVTEMDFVSVGENVKVPRAWTTPVPETRL